MDDEKMKFIYILIFMFTLIIPINSKALYDKDLGWGDDLVYYPTKWDDIISCFYCNSKEIEYKDRIKGDSYNLEFHVFKCLECKKIFLKE